MRTILFLLLSSSLVLADDKGIPGDSLDLIAKLQQFEKSEREKVEKAISEKRSAVIAILEQHLERETKAGNLDAALQLRQSIDGIKGASTFPAPAPKTTSETDSDNSNELDLTGSKWIGVDGKLSGGSIEFLDNGGMRVIDPVAPRPYGGWRYRVEGKALYITPSKSKEERVRLSRSNTKLEIEAWGEFERETKSGD